MSYHLKPGYRERLAPDYWVDDTGLTTWQPDVYPDAAALARQVGAVRLIDVGCGNGDKLAPHQWEFELVGIDYGPNIEECRRRHPGGKWLEADFDVGGPLPVPDPQRSMVICADVIEHVVHPELLLRKLHDLLERGALAVILTTPERDLRRGTAHQGPSPNPAHVREWNSRELQSFMAEERLEGHFGLTRTNDEAPFLHTILAAIPGRGLDDLESFERWWAYRERWQRLGVEHEDLYRELNRRLPLRMERRLKRLAHRLKRARPR
jgi:SAM-dependent methyltransferase